MLTPAPPDILAALADYLGQQPPSLPASVRAAANTHHSLTRGAINLEDFGRYCRMALPGLLRRLLEAESDLITVRTAVARHIATDDAGLDPAPSELRQALERVGISLGPDIDTATVILTAEIHAATYG